MNETLPDNAVKYSQPVAFSAALFKYVSHQTGREETHLRKDGAKPRMEEHTPKRMIQKGKSYEHPAEVGPSCTLRKEILMLSLNPSVYGNKYGVLGSS